ncbi:aldehyde dehydrogenase (NADP(+)) [Mucilaginibacter sp. KACC 22063]|uniref:aldehyde dehydrogenase (NADP(+)) n=1 Tax=Mucilaginibacter sp. KACC 22063 TaxID=3025666 RepID=UPI0023663896|nr:aldehyde dehydrogenase (NADP(+)) [Mucilaginibacter sp. KACC 22063]WDF57430.1 aldehyde dehydrogenase (NADP(+)) [Mucilaginibacter sp. KACC 22063]
MGFENIVACKPVGSGEGVFEAVNPSTGEKIPGQFQIADSALIDSALKAAKEACQLLKNIGGANKAEFLRAVADEIAAQTSNLVEIAMAESGLPQARLQGEVNRTTGQLRMFADLVAEGSWVNAVIDTAQPDRVPLPKPDIRKLLMPLGPVVVFGASNFPLAFSVAGGDTASAFAAGCPVIVKVHPAHPGTSALVGEAICKAALSTGMPQGIFSMLYDAGYTIGEQLVKHPETKAVAFTGSYNGGMALIKLAQQRHDLIPVFTEMGSINPVVFLPEALKSRPQELANKYAGSIALGAGQFCTNPGLMLAVQSPGLDQFVDTISEAVKATPSATMLTGGIWQNFQKLSEASIAEEAVSVIAQSTNINQNNINQAASVVLKVSGKDFLNNPKLQQEVFGPLSILVVAENAEQLEKIVETLHGQLTVTVMAEKAELSAYRSLLDKLNNIAGRLILNGVPTGVEVCAAMQHGGPFPATSDSRYTSVGTSAIYRFARPVAWQDWEDSLLPKELQDANPLNIWRLVNNQWTK